jgi:hypothetical protein
MINGAFDEENQINLQWSLELRTFSGGRKGYIDFEERYRSRRNPLRFPVSNTRVGAIQVSRKVPFTNSGTKTKEVHYHT